LDWRTVEFSRGFPSAATLSYGMQQNPANGDVRWATFEELVLRWGDKDMVAIVTDPAKRALRRLSTSIDLAVLIAGGKTALRLRLLSVSAYYRSKTIAALLTAMKSSSALPELKTLRMERPEEKNIWELLIES